MTSYEDWLHQIDQKLDQVDQGCAALLASVHDLRSDTETWALSCSTFAATAAGVFGPSGSTSASLDAIGAAEIDLCDLYSDYQVVVDWGWIMATGGLDPDRLFDPINGGHGGAANFEVRQSGTLQLFAGPAAAGNPTTLGNAGINVPIEISFLGTSAKTDLYVGVDLVRQQGVTQMVLAIVASPLRVISTPGLAAAARWTIETEARTPIAAALSSVAVSLPPISLLTTQPRTWSAWHDGSARLAGQVRKRGRGRQGYLAPSPGGFPVGVRFQLSVLTDEIAAEVRAMGVNLFSGPTVTGQKTFKLTAGVEFSKEVSLGPKSVAKARVKIWQAFEGRLTASGSWLFVNVTPVGGPGTDVSIRPKIPLLTQWVEDIVEDFIKSKIPTISGISRSFNLSGTSSFDVWLSSQFITLGIKPR